MAYSGVQTASLTFSHVSLLVYARLEHLPPMPNPSLPALPAKFSPCFDFIPSFLQPNFSFFVGFIADATSIPSLPPPCIDKYTKDTNKTAASANITIVLEPLLNPFFIL